MAKEQRRYTPEFRRQMVELHRAGHGFDALKKQYGCATWSIRQWVKQADRDVGRALSNPCERSCCIPWRAPPRIPSGNVQTQGPRREAGVRGGQLGATVIHIRWPP